MTAVGRALMAQPSMILLDEPSMGLAPQIVEEIFEIVRDLNSKERVSFLLAEQNTMVALRYANYGYILENGRVVMDGEAKRPRDERGREGVLPRACRRRGARASATSSTTAAASAGWPELGARPTTFRRAGNARSRAARARRSSPRCRGRSPTRRPHAPAFARILAGVDAAAVTSRAALARLPVTRKSELLELQKAARPVRRLRARRALGRSATRRVFASPGPDLRARRRASRLLAARAGAVRRGIPRRAISSTTASPITSRRRARCSKPARMRWAARCSPAARARPSSRCRRWPSCSRTATSARRRSCEIILEKADELGVALPSLRQGARLRRGVSCRSLRDALAARGIDGYQVYATRRPRHDRLRDAGARRASSSTKACWSRSCGRAPAIRSRRARSAKSSSRRSSNTDYPLIRFGTGDLSALLPGVSAVRPHQHAHQGLDGPRRPDDEGEGHVRASVAGRGRSSGAIRRSRGRGSSSTTRTATTA